MASRAGLRYYCPQRGQQPEEPMDDPIPFRADYSGMEGTTWVTAG